jgi:transposase
MPRLKFVQKLSEEIKRQLNEIYHNPADFAFSQRAHAILLSDKGFTMGQLQDIFEVDRDTVSAWISRFGRFGAEGLKSLPRPGRPPIHTADEVRQLKEPIDQEPRQIKRAQAALQQATGKSSCAETLKRALKKLTHPWHRCRRPLKGRCGPEAFEKENQNQQALHKMEEAGLINLYYFDGSGFPTLPSVPYAWQPVGTTLEVPSFPSKRLNVMGFMSRGQKAFFCPAEARADTTQAAEASGRFASRHALEYASHRKPRAVVIDNAPWHTSHAFLNRLDEWASHGIIVHYLPPLLPRVEPHRNPLAQNQIRLAALALLRQLRQPEKCHIRNLGRLRL